MGTHGLFCVRRKRSIVCVERTWDGHVYVELLDEFVRKLNERGSRETKKWLMKIMGNEYFIPNVETQIIDFQRWCLGTKMVEINGYREHEQVYTVMFNLNENKVYVNVGVLEAMGSIKRLCDVRKQLKRHKWDIEMGQDVEDLMTEEEREMYACEPEDLEDNPEMQRKYEVKVFMGTAVRIKEVTRLPTN